MVIRISRLCLCSSFMHCGGCSAWPRSILLCSYRQYTGTLQRILVRGGSCSAVQLDRQCVERAVQPCNCEIDGMLPSDGMRPRLRRSSDLDQMEQINEIIIDSWVAGAETFHHQWSCPRRQRRRKPPQELQTPLPQHQHQIEVLPHVLYSPAIGPSERKHAQSHHLPLCCRAKHQQIKSAWPQRFAHTQRCTQKRSMSSAA